MIRCTTEGSAREGIWSTLRPSMTAASEVSAVIPVHNGALYLADAIRSVLSQTRAPLECLVIDDGSTDATPEVAREFCDQIAYVRQDRQGVSAARNRGAQLARGELVAFLDHDDVWLPTRLERQLSSPENQDAALALCAVEVVDRAGTVVRTLRLRAPGDLVTGMLMFDAETVSCGSAGLFAARRACARRRL